MARVVAAGLGPAGPDLLTVETIAAIDRVAHRFLRTARHPAATAVPKATPAFDDVYDAADTLDEVYGRIVAVLVEQATAHGEVLYLVPGSPLVAERTVELLREAPVELHVLPALSFADLAWSHVGTRARLVDGHRLAEDAIGDPGPLLVVQCDSRQTLSDIKLSVEEGPTVTVLQRLGLADEAVFEVAWADLDRSFEPDHLTSLYVPGVAVQPGTALAAFAELVGTLRQRCPWDREQTHRSLTRYLIEETYETVEAIEEGDLGHLEEELGDLLFQVCFHATLGEEEGTFTLTDVARGIHEKLVRRHPHVFGSVTADTPDQVVANWDRIKQQEREATADSAKGGGVLDGVPSALPALLYAAKVQRRAALVGFDWSSVEGAYPKVGEELAELRADPSDEELGDLLFAVVNVARHLGLDPEAALRGATAKFRRRFAGVEALAAERGLVLASLELSELDRLWDEVKDVP